MKNPFLYLAVLILLGGCSKDEKTVTCADAGQVFSTADGAVIAMSLYVNNHISVDLPSYAVWTEKAGTIKTLYATCKAAHRGWDASSAHPEALPVWYARNAIEVEQPGVYEVDGVTSATPAVSPFILLVDFLPLKDNDTLSVYVEVNAAADKNEFYRDEINGQPSVIWRARGYTDPEGKHVMERFHVIGHGSVDGSDGLVHPDTTDITTALLLIEKIELDPPF